MSKFISKTGAFSLFTGAIFLVIYSLMVGRMMSIVNAAEDFCVVIKHSLWMPSTIIVFAGLLFLMLGFAVVYSQIAFRAGALGFIGIVVLEFAYLLQAAKVTWEIFIYPQLALDDATSFLIRDEVLWNSWSITVFIILSTVSILAGIIIFCISLYRSTFYTKLTSILLLVGAVLYGTGELIHMTVAITGILIFAAGCFMCGMTLLKKTMD
ncbi:MAG: hypothetical protein PF637_01060 [Spirochaetes bacterium]|nr:hypothetical protein [Spirochaetota bacterium]